MDKQAKSIFSEFTNLYSLTKTLRFELKPIGKTLELLKTNKVFEKDKLVNDNYQKIKYYFDLLHRRFATETLSDIELDLTEYYRVFLKFTKEKDEINRNLLQDIENLLRVKLVSRFIEKAKEWKFSYNEKWKREAKEQKEKPVQLKKNGIDILFENNNVAILKDEFQKKPSGDNGTPDITFIDSETGESKNLFEAFKGFHTYFTNFNESRKNFYSEKEQDTAIANRVITENLRRFCHNKRQYEEKRNIYDSFLSSEEKQIFELSYYNSCFIQQGIDLYNRIVGGEVLGNDTKIQGINEKINLYRQKAREKIPLFKSLYNQILGNKDEKSFRILEITDNSQVFPRLNEFIEHNDQRSRLLIDGYTDRDGKKIKGLFYLLIDEQNAFDLEKIYLTRQAINSIAGIWFRDRLYFENSLPHKASSSKEEKWKLDDYISLQEIKNALLGIQVALPKKWQYLTKIETSSENLFKEEYNRKKILSSNNYQSFLNVWKYEFEKCLRENKDRKALLLQMMQKDKAYLNHKEKKTVNGEIEVQKETIKDYADSALQIYRMMKYLLVKKEPANGTDESFYRYFRTYYDDYQIISYYNEFRNYLTKKPFSEDKIKLNFENGQLLGGWDKNKEADYLGVILRKNETYYLGLLHKTGRQIFRGKNSRETLRDNEMDVYEKMVYKFLPDPKKTLPKICFSTKNFDVFNPSEEVLRIKEGEEFKINTPHFSLESMWKMIDFYKLALTKYDDWRMFEFKHIKPTRDYTKNIGEFYSDIEKNSYKIWFEKVSTMYVDERVNNGQLYLFEIHNKDFNTKSIGRKNLHTLYFKSLFSDTNIESPILKLNGEAEVFFRPSSLKKEFDEKRKTKFKIIKNKRYTEDKIFFHCPIRLNFSHHEEQLTIRISKLLPQKPDINILGIDRGEKHLAYYCVINQEGKILESDSLNNPLGTKDYNDLLSQRAKDRGEARKNWQAIANIKEMKNGYISQVIRKICNLILKYNAIVVLENLNIGFKRGRQKIEKSVYQKLELALAQKLNYLVEKDAQKDQAGHYLKAYQLTPPIKTFRDIGKHCGIMFYTTAGYTSKTCPQCGFRPNLYSLYENKDKAKDFIKKFENIYYDSHRKCFVFRYNPANFINERERSEVISRVFTVYSDVIRYQLEKNEIGKWEAVKIDINERLCNLLREIKDLNTDIKIKLVNGDFDEKFYKDLLFYFKMIQQIRNSKNDENTDYISCPACGFHSDNPPGYLKDVKNGDANGAYNIARKGIILLNRIKANPESPDLFISNYDWDDHLLKYSPN